jgi:hypothetical protein
VTVEYPSINEIEELTGPMPRTRGECLAELMATTGLSAAELEAISGRDLTSDPDKPVP